MNHAITLETDLFEHREVKPHFINPCCFGEDFAAWLKGQLEPLTQDGFSFSEPIQEDYGWGLWAKRGKDSFWLALSYAGEGPQEEPAQWVVSIDDGRCPIVLIERITQVIKSNPSIRIVD